MLFDVGLKSCIFSEYERCCRYTTLARDCLPNMFLDCPKEPCQNSSPNLNPGTSWQRRVGIPTARCMLGYGMKAQYCFSKPWYQEKENFWDQETQIQWNKVRTQNQRLPILILMCRRRPSASSSSFWTSNQQNFKWSKQNWRQSSWILSSTCSWSYPSSPQPLVTKSSSWRSSLWWNSQISCFVILSKWNQSTSQVTRSHQPSCCCKWSIWDWGI